MEGENGLRRLDTPAGTDESSHGLRRETDPRFAIFSAGTATFPRDTCSRQFRATIPRSVWMVAVRVAVDMVRVEMDVYVVLLDESTQPGIGHLSSIEIQRFEMG